MKEEFVLGLYVSTLPCGDASTYSLSLLAPPTSASPVPSLPPPPSATPSTAQATSLGLHTSRLPSSTPTTLRGRIAYSALSALRTKPGRIDSPPTTSHSCSDKIALWGSVGVQGALLGSLVGRVELGILVVGGVAREEWERLGEEVHRAVAGRLGRTMGVAFTEMEFEGSKKGSEASCPESISWIAGEGVEILTNGLRQGASPKRKSGEALGPKARSRISKLGLLERYTEVDQLLRSSPGPLPIDASSCDSYYDAKHQPRAATYQEAKCALRAVAAPFEGWIVSGKAFESFGVDGRLQGS